MLLFKSNISIKVICITALFIGIVNSGCDIQSQAQLNNIIGQINKPSTIQIVSGLKEALEVGASISSSRLAQKDGFFSNSSLKILFPKEAQKAEQAIRNIGLGGLADNVILTINRAAETAVIEAKPIFIAAIKQMTINDAYNILFGNTNAATEYFKSATNSQLTEKFKPIIQLQLNKVGATKYWGEVSSKYNLISKNPIDTDLSAYVTQKAIEGLFQEIAVEEAKIRLNINARTSPLLQQVFGYADRNK